MRNFEEIYAIAAGRHGGFEALEAKIPKSATPAELAAIADDRWLADMTKRIFQAGFNWQVIENKWDGFEAAFDGFDIGRCSMLSDEDFDRLVADKRVVRNGVKLRSVQENAVFLSALAREHGSAGKAFAEWPSTDYIGLLDLLKSRGSRLGGNTGQYFLRHMGKDSFVLSRDVTARLIAEGVIDKPPSSKRAMAAVQGAFNTWMEQSGRDLTAISRVLAMSIG
ncbi:MAG: DNA-3-methyladenine glycosylase I [Nitratireductor sp.]|nr:DNA-3-methyladenine glycosylase I [Nitratireductor sp.]